MLYVCKPEFVDKLGIKSDAPYRILGQMLARDDLQPRYVGFDGSVSPNTVKLEGPGVALAKENFGKIGYVMLHPDDNVTVEHKLREAIINDVRELKKHFQIVMSYQQGLQTDAAQALTTLRELTGVKFTLHMTRLNPLYTERWHLDYTGEHTTAIYESDRRKIVASLSLNHSFEGNMKSYIEVTGGWSNTRYRDKMVFLNPRDDLHRVVIEEDMQRSTLLFRTTELTVPEFRDALEGIGMLEGEARR